MAAAMNDDEHDVSFSIPITSSYAIVSLSISIKNVVATAFAKVHVPATSMEPNHFQSELRSIQVKVPPDISSLFKHLPQRQDPQGRL